MGYHMLYVREEGAWAPQFGDKDRECVVEEMRDMIYSDQNQRGSGAISRKDCKIIEFKRMPTQRQVDERTDFLNGVQR